MLNSGTQTIGFTPDGSNRVLLMAYAFVLINMSLQLTREEKFHTDIHEPNYQEQNKIIEQPEDSQPNK